MNQQLPLLDFVQAVEILKAGGVIAGPTETFYGILAVAHDSSVARVLALKNAPVPRALPLVAAGLKMVRRVALLDDALALRLAGEFWPGPLTLVLPLRPAVRDSWPAAAQEEGAIAVRVPGLPLLRNLCARCQNLLTATSANFAGQPPPAAPGEIDPRLADQLDGLLDGGPVPGGKPSTIIKIVSGSIICLRDGAVPFADLLAAREE